MGNSTQSKAPKNDEDVRNGEPPGNTMVRSLSSPAKQPAGGLIARSGSVSAAAACSDSAPAQIQAASALVPGRCCFALVPGPVWLSGDVCPSRERSPSPPVFAGYRCGRGLVTVGEGVRCARRLERGSTPRSWRRICVGRPAWTRRASLRSQTRTGRCCGRRGWPRAGPWRLRLAVQRVPRCCEALQFSPRRDRRRRRRRPNAQVRRRVVLVSSS